MKALVEFKSPNRIMVNLSSTDELLSLSSKTVAGLRVPGVLPIKLTNQLVRLLKKVKIVLLLLLSQNVIVVHYMN